MRLSEQLYDANSKVVVHCVSSHSQLIINGLNIDREVITDGSGLIRMSYCISKINYHFGKVKVTP